MKEKLDHFRRVNLSEETVRAFTELLPSNSQPNAYEYMRKGKLECLVFFLDLNDNIITQAKEAINIAYPTPKALPSPAQELDNYLGVIVRVPTERLMVGTEWFPGSSTDMKIGDIQFLARDKILGSIEWNAFIVVKAPTDFFRIVGNYTDSETKIIIRFSKKQDLEVNN